MLAAAQETVSSVEPFDAIAAEYDDIFSNSSVGRAQRGLVWGEMDRMFRAGQRILEINCGTGVDAHHLAERGIRVLACDSSSGMVAVTRKRLRASECEHLVEVRQLAIENLAELRGREAFDGIFSNFGGLNCVSEMRSVALDLAALVKPGGAALICVFGRFCLWETLWYLAHGKKAKAFRRLKSEGNRANLSPGTQVLVRYPSVQSIQRAFSPHFRLKTWKGVGIAIPPSYVEKLACQFATLLRAATRFDSLFGSYRGIRGLADHAVLTFEKV